MISLNYINGNEAVLFATDPYLKFESSMEEASSEIDMLISQYNVSQISVLTESEIMGENQNNLMMLESEGKNIFEKIGDAIIKMIKDTIKLIGDVIDKLKNIKFSSKSDLEKLDELVKKNPSLKDEIVTSFKKGELEVSDARSLKELQATYDEIVKLSKQADVNPKSLRAKWTKAKEKFENADKATIVKVAAGTTAVVTCAVTLATFMPKIIDGMKKMNENKKELNSELASAINDLKNNPDIDTDHMSALQLRKEATMYMNKSLAADAHKYDNVFQKLSNGIRGIGKGSKADNKAKERLLNGAEKIAERNKKEKDKEESDRLRKLYNDERIKTRARNLEANRELTKNYTHGLTSSVARSETNKAYYIAQAQAEGRDSANLKDKGPQHIIVHMGDDKKSKPKGNGGKK